MTEKFDTWFCIYYLEIDGWSLQHGYKDKAMVLENPEDQIEIPFRTLIPGLRGGLSFKLNLQVIGQTSFKFEPSKLLNVWSGCDNYL